MTNNIKYNIGESLISFLGLSPMISIQRQMTFGDNPLSEFQAKSVREEAKLNEKHIFNLRESFIKTCISDEKILLQWIKDNKEEIKKQNSLIADCMINELEKQDLI